MEEMEPEGAVLVSGPTDMLKGNAGHAELRLSAFCLTNSNSRGRRWIFNITTQRALTRVILNQMVFYINMKPVNCSQEFVYREEGLRFILFMPFMFKLSYHTTSPSFSFENVNRNYQD